MESKTEKLSWLGEIFVTADGKEVKLEELTKVKLILIVYSASW